MSERKQIMKQEVQFLQSLLPENALFLYGQEGRCSGCREWLTYGELEKAARNARLNLAPVNNAFFFVLVWCESCGTQPVAQQLAISELREAARLGPHVDGIWVTVSPKGEQYVVSEGVPFDSQTGEEELSLRLFHGSDYPGGFGAINFVAWKPEYEAWLAGQRLGS